MSSEKALQWAGYARRYLEALSLATAAMVIAMHATTPPRFEVFRMPSDLHRTSDIWGLNWPRSFETYHLFITVLTISATVTWLGLARLPERRWQLVCAFSSFVGAAFSFVSGAYFLLELDADRGLTRLDLTSAALFAAYSALWVVANAFVFFVSSGVPERALRWRSREWS